MLVSYADFKSLSFSYGCILAIPCLCAEQGRDGNLEVQTTGYQGKLSVRKKPKEAT